MCLETPCKLEKQRIGGVYLRRRRCDREQLPDSTTNKIFELDDVGAIQLAECSKKLCNSISSSRQHKAVKAEDVSVQRGVSLLLASGFLLE
jgi:hypothetical protein